MDPLDDPPIPIRSVNEPEIEKINTISINKHGNNGSGCIVVEEIIGSI